MLDLLELLSFGPNGWGDEILQGALLTIQLALVTLPVGIAIGLAVAVAKDSHSRLLRAVGDLYTTVFRGLPELLTLFIVYYGGQMLLTRLAGYVVEGAHIEVNQFVAGVVALGLVLGAFSSEVLLAAIRAVPKGQKEAASALGLSGWSTFRLVTFPQLWRIALPGLSNNWMVLLKDTSLVSVIAITDLMRQTSIAVGVTKQPFFFYLVACLIYLVFSGLSSIVFSALENRASRGFKRVGGH
ncbi:amino acid ABC transporter membrane protein 1 (PAAT family) [Ancylobacter aquaticus]|uniref:Amino acid ABC transporter membrane protein 1 (PAAT family) n=1 Tax=Ancylobacter aquaticus TaxID=100 RepID=A0A4R1ICB1_ANCAQ|nr:ABC transporter permease [Ancylobacter aquaticus]TCK31460.1 amino acid ABC transporter membrane protein 1 (PAAT family) [Ancylobacter aquaticus]